MSAGPRLFVYGTLLFPEVVSALIGRQPPVKPATVDGWRAARLRGRPYPGLVPARPEEPAQQATGLVLSGLDRRDRAVLDAFEGEAYEAGTLVLSDGLPAIAYLWRDRAEVTAEDWDPAAFAERHLADYAVRCAAWRRGLAVPPP